MLEHALRPLFSYLHAVVVPTGVFAATDDFGDRRRLQKRIERAAAELAALVAERRRPYDGAGAAAAAEPVTPFEQLLREAGGDSVR